MKRVLAYERWQVTYFKQALKDLNSINQYIAFELLAPKTASEQADRIMTEIEGLDETPHRCPLLEKNPWRERGLR